jgi:hypothetical protein
MSRPHAVPFAVQSPCADVAGAGAGAGARAVLPTACPGRKLPFWGVKRPVRPYKRAAEKPIYCAHMPQLGGPRRHCYCGRK